MHLSDCSLNLRSRPLEMVLINNRNVRYRHSASSRSKRPSSYRIGFVSTNQSHSFSQWTSTIKILCASFVVLMVILSATWYLTGNKFNDDRGIETLVTRMNDARNRKGHRPPFLRPRGPAKHGRSKARFERNERLKDQMDKEGRPSGHSLIDREVRSQQEKVERDRVAENQRVQRQNEVVQETVQISIDREDARHEAVDAVAENIQSATETRNDNKQQDAQNQETREQGGGAEVHIEEEQHDIERVEEGQGQNQDRQDQEPVVQRDDVQVEI